MNRYKLLILTLMILLVIGIVTNSEAQTYRVGNPVSAIERSILDSLHVDGLIRGDSATFTAWINADSLHVVSLKIDSIATITFIVTTRVKTDTLDNNNNVSIVLLSNIIPGANKTYDLGSLALALRDVFGRTVYVDTLSSTGDVNTGFVFTGNDSIKVYTNGTGRLLIDPSGNLVPYTSLSQDFGTLAKVIRQVFAGNVLTDSLSGRQDTNTLLVFPGSDTVAITNAGSRRILIDPASNISADVLAGSANSPSLSLIARNAGTAQTAILQTANGADPYLRMSVPNNSGTATSLLDFHDTVIAAVTDNTVDIGTATDNRPKNLYLAGAVTVNRANIDTLDKKNGTSIRINDDLIPLGSTKTLDFGSAAQSWRDANFQAVTTDSLNKVIITQPANSATLTLADGKTFTVNKTMRLTSDGDNGVLTMPNATATIPAMSDKLSVFAATTSAELAGVISDETGTNKLVYSNAPSLYAPLADTLKGLGDTNTQIVFSGNDTTKFVNNGLTRLWISPTGILRTQNIFINKEDGDSYYALDVGIGSTGSLRTSGITVFNQTGGNLNVNNNFTSIGVNQFYVDKSTGKLGIGMIPTSGSARTTIKGIAAAGDTVLALQDSSGADKVRVLGSGQSLFSAGSVAAPGISSIGDPNTGIVFSGNDTTKFVQGGVTWIRIDPDGVCKLDSEKVIIKQNGTIPSLYIYNNGKTSYLRIAESNIYSPSALKWQTDAGLTFWGGDAASIDFGNSINGINFGSWKIGTKNLGIGVTSNLIARTTIKGRAAAGDTVLALQDSAGVERFKVLSNGNTVLNSDSLTVAATTGFPYFSWMKSPPSGTPTSYLGRFPVTFDSTNQRLYVYGPTGAWKYFAIAGGFEVPKEEVDGLNIGDYVIGKLDGTKSDGALHGHWVKAPEGLEASAQIEELEKKIAALESRLKKLEPKPVTKKKTVKKK